MRCAGPLGYVFQMRYASLETKKELQDMPWLLSHLGFRYKTGRLQASRLQGRLSSTDAWLQACRATPCTGGVTEALGPLLQPTGRACVNREAWG
jgi:hypothetical protein